MKPKALCGRVPADKLEETVNVGTLFAFPLVSGGVIILRRTRPDLSRAFRAPLVHGCLASVCACLRMMVNLPSSPKLLYKYANRV